MNLNLAFICWPFSPCLHLSTILRQWDTVFQEQLDPFSLVADELSLLADRLRSMVVAEVSNCSLSLYIF